MLYCKKALFPWVLGLFVCLPIIVFSSFIVKNSLIYSRFRSFSICSGFSEGMCNSYSKSSDCIACKQLYFYLFYQSYTALCTTLLLCKWNIHPTSDRQQRSILCANQDDLFLIAIWNFTGLREKLILLMMPRNFRSREYVLGAGVRGRVIISKCGFVFLR